MSSPKHLAALQDDGGRGVTSHSRYHGLDLLKAIAILAIAAHHFQQDFGIRYETLNFYGGRFYVGYVVELFFMVSGFVLVLSEAHRSQAAIMRPLLRRVARLWPMAAISVLVATALWPAYQHFSGLLWDGLPLRPVTFFVSLTTVSQGAFFNSYSYNNPLWYVGVLIICYVLFYLLRRLASAARLPAWPLFVLASAIGAFAQLNEIDVPFLRFNSTARGYAAFFLGVLISTAMHRLSTRKHPHVFAVTMAAIALGAFSTMCFSDELLQYEWPIETFVVWPVLLLAVIWSPIVERVSDNPFVAFLGRINYELYVWHAVLNIAIATVCAAVEFPIPTSRVALLVYLVLCEAIGAFFYYVCEAPLSRILNGRISVR